MSSKGKQRQAAPEAVPPLVKTSNSKLAIIVLAFVRAPELFMPSQNDEEVVQTDVVNTLGPQFPPLWLKEKPTEPELVNGEEPEWMGYWTDEEWRLLRGALKKAVDKFMAMKKTRPVDFRWKNNAGVKGDEKTLLEGFAAWAEKKNWHLRLDAAVDNFLVDRHATVKEMFDADEESEGLPDVNSWSNHWSAMGQAIFGFQKGWNTKVPEKIVQILKAMVTLRIDAIRSWYKRQTSANRKRMLATTNDLGNNWLFSKTVPAGLTTKKLLAAHKRMTQYQDVLAFTRTTSEERALMEEEIDLEAEDALDRLRERWVGLPEAVKYQEVCFTSIGWMAALIKRRTGKDPLEDIEFSEDVQQTLVDRGLFLGNAVQERAVNAMAEMTAGDAAHFRHEVTAYVAEVNTREPSINMRNLQSLLEDREPEDIMRDLLSEAGDTIGINAYAKWDKEQLGSFLGLQNGCPLGFREWTCKEKLTECLKRRPEDRCEHAVDLSIFWHQLCCLVRIFDNIFHSQRGNIEGLMSGGPQNKPEKAPIALREGWSNIPGILLALDVGMGKTVTTLAMIAIYAAMVDAQEAAGDKRCDIGVIGTSDVKLPSAGHLLAVPNGLVAQWKEEIFKYLKPGSFAVFEVRRTKTTWERDIAAYVADTTAEHRKILVISQTTLKRMWDEQGGGKYGGHSVVKWPQKKTIWNISFGSVTMDEGHIARGENKFTDTFDGAFALGFTKNNMTATPLMQGPSDLRSMARLTRPPKLTEFEMINFGAQEQDLKKLKRSHGVKLEELTENPEYMTDLTHDLGGSLSNVFSKMMVLKARNWILPHMLRVTKSTLDNNGDTVMKGLPSNTTIIVSVPLSGDELSAADTAFKEVVNADATKKDASIGLEGMSALRFGHFLLKARRIVSLGTTIGLDDDDIDVSQPTPQWFLPLHCSKLKTALIVVSVTVKKGPAAVVPKTRTVYNRETHEWEEIPLHGTQNQIVEIEELGLQVAQSAAWKEPEVFSASDMKKKGLPIHKVVVYFSMAHFHPVIVAMFEAFGIHAVAMNGGMSSAARAKIQKLWETTEAIPVLIISDAGTQGLNLVAAEAIIMLDTPWSEVEVIQINARAWRFGQTQETFLIRLMGKQSVEVMMVANGIAKRDMLQSFMNGASSPHLIRALTGAGTQEDEEALLEAMDITPQDIDEVASALGSGAKSTLVKGKSSEKSTEKKPRKKAAPKKSKAIVESEDDPEKLPSSEPIDVDADAAPARPKPKRVSAKKASTKAVSNLGAPRRSQAPKAVLPDLDSDDDDMPPAGEPDVEMPFADNKSTLDENEDQQMPPAGKDDVEMPPAGKDDVEMPPAGKDDVEMPPAENEEEMPPTANKDEDMAPQEIEDQDMEPGEIRQEVPGRGKNPATSPNRLSENRVPAWAKKSLPDPQDDDDIAPMEPSPDPPSREPSPSMESPRHSPTREQSQMVGTSPSSWARQYQPSHHDTQVKTQSWGPSRRSSSPLSDVPPSQDVNAKKRMPSSPEDKPMPKRAKGKGKQAAPPTAGPSRRYRHGFSDEEEEEEEDEDDDRDVDTQDYPSPPPPKRDLNFSRAPVAAPKPRAKRGSKAAKRR